MTVIYYPFYHWVHDRLAEGRLPLICDWAYHGAPIAAVSMVGVLSPSSGFSIFFHLLRLSSISSSSPPISSTYLGLISSAGSWACPPALPFLLAFLWAYNGHQSAQLDHLNVAWAHGFFPWAWAALLRYMGSRNFFWLLASSLLLSLCLLSGHPRFFSWSASSFSSGFFSSSRSTPFSKKRKPPPPRFFSRRSFLPPCFFSFGSASRTGAWPLGANRTAIFIPGPP